MDKSNTFHCLKKEEFFRQMLHCLRNELGSGCRIRLEPVLKNNGLRLHAVLITENSGNFSPALYLEPYYQSYLNGIPVSTLARRMAAVYRNHRWSAELSLEELFPGDTIRDRILFRLIHYNRNRELLEEVPHIPFLDLAVVFYFTVSHSCLGTGSCLLRYAHLNELSLTEAGLWPLALKNTSRILPARVRPMEELLPEMLRELTRENSQTGRSVPEELPEHLFPETCPMYVLTNPGCYYGAACLLYPDVLSDFAARLDSDLYILPSSIHEVILLARKNAPEQSALSEMVRQVNEADVPLCDQLSDRVYCYQKDLDRITL